MNEINVFLRFRRDYANPRSNDKDKDHGRCFKKRDF